MSTVNMDRLLQACVEQDASDIHITVGKPPVFRVVLVAPDDELAVS